MIVYDIQDLVKRYPGQTIPANNHISLQICQGEIFGLLGENGAGKSTLIRQMVNLTKTDSGTIALFGKNIMHHPLDVSMQVGYMPQGGRALNNLTVSEACFFTAHLRGLSRQDAHRERDRLIETWQMQDIRKRYCSKLSGGQMRLLQLAIAMAGSPPVLILDEPTNDLDPQHRKLVWDVLRHLNSEQGTTIIFITHNAIEAEKIIQRVGIMRKGELVALGEPLELKKKMSEKLRLELFFTPEAPPSLPFNMPYNHIEPGHWLVFVKQEQVPLLLNWLSTAPLDDFRFYSATLEDLYWHYATQTS